jgi:membrane-bound lytic murein transglycosylase D
LSAFLLSGCAKSIQSSNQDMLNKDPGAASNIQTRSETGNSSGSSARSSHLSWLHKTFVDDEDEINRPIENDDPIDFGIENQNILDEALDYCQLAQDFWQKGKLDNALQALDSAYALILRVNVQGRPRLIQQKDDLRHLISKRIMEIYASRNVTRPLNHNSIPMVLNQYVQAEINLMTKGAEKDFFTNAYQRSGRYRKWIEEQLIKEGLPPELSWLPLIESGYKSTAYSPARALGLWQFIASTGYRFGLNRDQYIDERLDPYKSTKAAIAYLKELHSLFGDWETVLAAYNCGENKVLRTISGQCINYLDNFWDLYEKLPQETARYVPRFIATLHIISDPAKYGLADITPEPPLEYESVDIYRNIHLKNVAQATEIPFTALKLLNPELRLDITPSEGYSLKLPTGTKDILLAKLDEIPDTTEILSEVRPQEAKHPTHVVAKGETLHTISKKYHVPVFELAKLNHLKVSSKLNTGQLINLPQSGSKPTTVSVSKIPPEPLKTKKAAAKIEPKPPVQHVVQKGENLFSIASRYGTTVQAIQRLNNISSNNLTIGQTLQIPPEIVAPSKPLVALKKYEVKKGDNPISIANRHKMPVDRFLSINNLTEKSKLVPGQKVYVE